MLKKIGKICGAAIIAFLLAVIAWYFILIKIPEQALVQGTAAQSLSREQGRELLHYHGARMAYVKNGEWYFFRNGKECRLIPKLTF